ncbi:primosomal protein N' [Altericista sp. CCNU0014]|uniref:primosomal protein N' n=1 Tax=Altericista sp. CCNU0014 TaxID=3082949 RepID=UPI00384DE57D
MEPESELMPSYVEVLVDCPGHTGLLTYRVPAGVAIAPGDILSVDFGARQVGAIAVRLTATPPPDLAPEQIREVAEAVSDSLFPPGYWALLERVADYYYTPLMTAIRVALPPGLLQRSQRRVRLLRSEMLDLKTLSVPARQIVQSLQGSATRDYAWSYIQQRVEGAAKGLRELKQLGWVEMTLQPPAHSTQPKRQQKVTLLNQDGEDLTPRQREILAVLAHNGGELWLQDLLKYGKTTAPTLQKIAQAGCVAITLEERLRLEERAVSRDRPLTLTADQQAALAAIRGLSGCATVLLHGVTGSGKTEVYLQAIAPILKQGKSALVLVPEIGLTPQLTDRFRARFGSRVRVYHSALSDGERYDTWRYLLNKEPQVVIGTRSAVFAPLPNLGAIVLDEEHDSGYKQEQPAPCYHARTVAGWRSQLSDCPLILGSATPSLETYTLHYPTPPTSGQGKGITSLDSPLVKGGGRAAMQDVRQRYYLSLPQRVQSRPLPPITVVDMRQELQNGNRSMFGQTLQKALREMKAQQQQGILFVQRRGHSTFVSCRSCGYVMDCPNCSVSLTYHHESPQRNPFLRCHYCNFIQQQPKDCPACTSPYFRFFGTGTQRVIETLNREFPELRLLRFDSDTTRRKGAHRDLLQQFAEGEADLLVGTQMLTKGIDLPQVQLVAVLAADGLLNLPDFRASERAVQTLLQVAGRAGRGETPGQVILQTYCPETPAIGAVQRYEFQACMDAELRLRAELNYPPYGQLISLRISGPEMETVEKAADRIAAVLKAAINRDSATVEVLGPAPANILRVAGRFRWQLLLKLPPNLEGNLHQWKLPIQEMHDCCNRHTRLTIDVDPLSLL